MRGRRSFLGSTAGLIASCAVSEPRAEGQPTATHAAVPAVTLPPSAPARAAVRTAGWEREWEELVAAARQEGRVSLITWGDRAYLGAIERFEAAFPGVTVERLAESSASVWLEAVRRARRTGAQSFDLAFVQPDAALTEGVRDGLWAPIRPLLFHPDVVAEEVWRDGLANRFLDVRGELCFDWECQVFRAYAVNTDLVTPGQIRSVTDLLDPKWRGKIVTSEPELGAGLMSAANVLRSHGEGVLKRLLVDQRPVMISAARERVEALIRGRFAFAFALRPKALAEFREAGAARNVALLDLPDADFVPSTALLYLDRAPHPAAARLFANWILTREGQTVLAEHAPTNSARLDVPPFEPDGIATPGAAYFDPDRESSYAHLAATRRTVMEVLRRSR
ncbi:MAG TPA: substrate-binding domain-containing protein [Chloroflexota bacterium]|nr:substrate-binding domain-containing protein [Chloroflexota bacterium]